MRPNILLIIADQRPASALGCYDCAVRASPHLDDWAAPGVRFGRHYANVLVCGPRHDFHRALSGRDGGGSLIPRLGGTSSRFSMLKNPSGKTIFQSETTMSQVTFISPEGEAVVVDNAVGNLMEIATAHEVKGIEGSCGGVCSCGTCHVWVRPEWLERVGQASEVERDVLDSEDNRNERSRLCCQIEMSDALDSLVVEVAS